MKHIQITVLNSDQSIRELEDLMVFGARLTQKGPTLTDVDKVRELFESSHSQATTDRLSEMPHPTIRQFGNISVVVTGASRRFLAQITRRRVGVTFMSGSLHYSDFSSQFRVTEPELDVLMSYTPFVVPYELYARGAEVVGKYLCACDISMREYKSLLQDKCSTDTAGYVLPQSLRNVLLISATPQAWIEMISQRICRRCSSEIRYIMLRIWALLQRYPMFESARIGCDCMQLDGRGCSEGHMSCGHSMHYYDMPNQILLNDFPLIN